MTMAARRETVLTRMVSTGYDAKEVCAAGGACRYRLV